MARNNNNKKLSFDQGLSGAIGGLSSIAGGFSGNYINGDTSDIESQIDSLRNTGFNLGDYGSLESAYNPYSLMGNIDYESIRGVNAGQKVTNTLNSAFGAASAGSMFGPVGTIVGGALGLGAGIFGAIAGDAKARRRQEELEAESKAANNDYINNVSANADRIGDNMFRNKAINLSAFGGRINPFNKFAFGGAQDEFSNGATIINNGGTHESNPNEGVQIGVDNNGTPNLVEEGEVIYNDYVFSNRLKPTRRQLVDINLPEKYYGKTYAEIAKVIQKGSEEMPNDPIERRGLEDGMSKLMAIQDETKQKRDQSRLIREFNSMPDEDKFALINGLQRQAMAQQERNMANQQEGNIIGSDTSDGYDNAPTPNQEEGIASQMSQYDNTIGGYAFGGRLFANGGIKYDRSYDDVKAKAYEAEKSYADKIDVINRVINGDASQREINTVKRWFDTINSNKDMNGYSLKDYNDFLRLATDRKIGPVHRMLNDFEYTNNNPIERVGPIDMPNPLFDIPSGSIIPRGEDYNAPADVTEQTETDTNVDNNLRTNNPEWLRYAPLAASGAAVIGDLFGANRPDYSLWGRASRAAGRVNYVSPQGIGDYLAYNPYDVNYMQGRVASQNAMTQRNILNTASGNRGAALSGLLASNNQFVNNMGDLYRQSLEYNDRQRQAVGDFNRGTDQFNAQQSMGAQSQNAQLDRQRVGDLMQLAAQKQNILNNSRQTRAENITNLATLMGRYGRENFDFNRYNALVNNGYLPKLSCGGKIRRRRK